MLVALGAAVMTIIAFELFDALQLLGGGAIIRGNGEVQGLTTAANIWLCGAVELACGAGHYVLAAVSEAAQTQTGSAYTSANETCSRQ